jgi:8-oxo-dGTP pyrophosphatase MutT (NUDIX family)
MTIKPSLTDRVYQGFYWLAFRLLRVWWFFRRPHQRGALVLIHHSGRTLLVRTSYQGYWSAPGGNIDPTEQPIEAACRELREEIGIDVSQSVLSWSFEVEHCLHHRRDRVWLFEWHPEEKPNVSIDFREIIEARWFTREEALKLLLLPHLRTYFQQQSST